MANILDSTKVVIKGDWVIMVPKTHYLDDGVKLIDQEKSFEEIKKLSDALASKTEDKVNHWNATNSQEVYNSYKSQDGFNSIFLVLVKKDQEGHPNWDERYLYYYGNDGEGFAAECFDKNGTRVIPEKVFSDSALAFVDKVVRNSVYTKKAAKFDAFVDSAESKAKADKRGDKELANTTKTVFPESLLNKMNGGPQTQLPSLSEMAAAIAKAMPWLKIADDDATVNALASKLRASSRFEEVRPNVFVDYKDNIILNTHVRTKSVSIIYGNVTKDYVKYLLRAMDNSGFFSDNMAFIADQILTDGNRLVNLGTREFMPALKNAVNGNLEYLKRGERHQRLGKIATTVLTPSSGLNKTFGTKMGKELQKIFDDKYYNVYLGGSRPTISRDIVDGAETQMLQNKETGTIFYVSADKWAKDADYTVSAIRNGKKRLVGMLSDKDIEQKIDRILQHDRKQSH